MESSVRWKLSLRFSPRAPRCVTQALNMTSVLLSEFHQQKCTFYKNRIESRIKKIWCVMPHNIMCFIQLWRIQMCRIFFKEFSTSLALALLGSRNIQLQASILRTSQPPGSFWDSEREFVHASSDVPKPRFESLGLTSPWRHPMLDQPRGCRKLRNYHRLS